MPVLSRSLRFSVLALALPLAISGKAQTQSELSDPVRGAAVDSRSALPSGAEADSNVIIYRDYAEPTAFAATVSINGSKRVTLPQKTYTSVMLDPGDHTIKVSWPFIAAQKSAESVLSVSPGKIYYLKIEGRSKAEFPFGGIFSIVTGIGDNRKVSVASDEGIEASRIDNCCKHKAAFKAK